MTLKTIEAILDAAEGMTRAEWELVNRYVMEMFDAAARRVALQREDTEAIARRLCNEQGIGSAPAQPANRQTRMF